jgi:hypothetical protein
MYIYMDIHIYIYIYIYDIFLTEWNASILGPQGVRIIMYLHKDDYIFYRYIYLYL